LFNKVLILNSVYDFLTWNCGCFELLMFADWKCKDVVSV